MKPEAVPPQADRSGAYQNNKEEKKMLGKILCFAIGGMFGFVFACCLSMAGREDERMGLK